ncbi:hypothetical protein MTYP_01050 [Methylophilaceae bacterium]|nr:hypothetical protein MTYP_01050 [Methylophilaceae bacterium]
MIPADMTITVNGVESTSLEQADALTRAVIISLFTWRRANAEDVVEGSRMGYWGDLLAPAESNDRIGSRLWLLAREKVLPSTFIRAREYAREALQWLLDDGIASKVEVAAERWGMDGLALNCVIYKTDGNKLSLRFDQAWEFIRAV